MSVTPLQVPSYCSRETADVADDFNGEIGELARKRDELAREKARLHSLGPTDFKAADLATAQAYRGQELEIASQELSIRQRVQAEFYPRVHREHVAEGERADAAAAKTKATLAAQLGKLGFPERD